MIESRYWRKELAKDIKHLNKLRKCKDWSEKKQVLFEREIMIIAFQIRSLLERPKVSNSIRNATIRLRQFPATSAPSNDWLFDDILTMYDWKSAKSEQMNVAVFCNQIIHQRYMFAQAGSSDKFTDLIFVSDHKVMKNIYKLKIKDMINLFTLFTKPSSGTNRAGVTLMTSWDEKKRKYTTKIIEDDE